MKAFSIIIVCALLTACGNHTTPAKTENEVPAISSRKDFTEIQQLIKQYPDSIFLYEQLIDSLKADGQYEVALHWFDTIINKNLPDQLKYEFFKGKTLVEAGMFDSAIATFNRYLHQFPDDEEALKLLANSYAEIGDSSVFLLSKRIVARYPTREMRANMGYIKGIYYNNKKEYAHARKWLDTCILLNYTFADAYIEKGYSYYSEGNFTEALKTFAILSELETNNADAYYWMGKTEEALVHKTEAISYYQQSLILDPSIKEAEDALKRLGIK